MVKDYKGDASVATGETFEPTPANLEARTQRFTLPNGMRVALLPKKTRGETVQFQLRLHHGDEASLKGMPPRGAMAAAMLAMGTKKRDRQAFEDALDQLRAKLALAAVKPRLLPRGQTLRAHLPELLRLVAETLREPAFPAAEFDKLKREHRPRSRSSAPIRRASPIARSAGTTLTSGDARYVPTSMKSSPRSSANTASSWQSFHSALLRRRNAELAIVGDFDPDAIRALATELFGAGRAPRLRAGAEPLPPSRTHALTCELPTRPTRP